MSSGDRLSGIRKNKTISQAGITKESAFVSQLLESTREVMLNLR